MRIRTVLVATAAASLVLSSSVAAQSRSSAGKDSEYEAGLARVVQAVAVGELQKLNPESVALDIEIATHLCRTQQGEVHVHGTAKGRPGRVSASSCPKGEKQIGHLRTNGRAVFEGPTFRDRLAANADRSMVFFTATSCRSIYRLQGPSSAAVLLEEQAPEKPFVRLSDQLSKCGDSSRNAEVDADISNEERLLTERIERLVLSQLGKWNKESVFLDVEWAGRICQTRNGELRVHGVRQGTADSVLPDRCPIGEAEVGHFHTHGRWGTQGFSGPDMASATSTPSVRVYVATPCRSVFRVWKSVATQLGRKVPQKPFNRYLGPTLTCVV